MRRTVATIVIVLGVVLGAAAPPAAATEPAIEADFVAAINGVRARAGLPPLAVHDELTAVARRWSATMASQNRIWHNANLGSDVTTYWQLVGENVGTGYDVPSLMQAFVDSPSHYRNLVEPDYDWVGVGVTWGSDGRMYTAHVFMDFEGQAPPAPSPQSAPSPAPVPEPEPAAPVVAPEPARVEAVLAAVRAVAAGVH